MIRRFAAVLLCAALVLAGLLPAAAPAEEKQIVVRVGWYDTPFNYKDSFGRRMGYAYEYQRKIAAYTGWKYEYIEGTWPELMEMLRDGRIDLMSDVSFMEERVADMLFSNLPMGSEQYYLYVAPGDSRFSVDDPASLNGKTIGVTKGTVQRDLCRRWLESRGITAVMKEFDTSEAESLQLLADGKIDVFVTLDAYGDPDLAIPLWRIGASDFYFAVSKSRPDLLADLDTAMSRIQEENKHFSDQLSEKYLVDSGMNRFLTAEETDWLKAHGKIRVGYQDKYLAFCAADPKTGQLTGALKDYLEYAGGVLGNAEPEFETVAYPTAADAIEALKNGEIDCMFPANLTDYDGEAAGVVMTAPLMRTEMDAVVRMEDRQDFLRNSQVRVGVNSGNPNYEMFLLDHFPGWTPVYYADTPACLDAVAARAIDCIIISNYRFSNISRQCDRLDLTTVYTGVDMDYCFAVREGNTTLYSILSKIIRRVPDATVNSALTYYSADSATTGAIDLRSARPLLIGLGGACGALLITTAFLIFKLQDKKRKK